MPYSSRFARPSIEEDLVRTKAYCRRKQDGALPATFAPCVAGIEDEASAFRDQIQVISLVMRKQQHKVGGVQLCVEVPYASSQLTAQGAVIAGTLGEGASSPAPIGH